MSRPVPKNEFNGYEPTTGIGEIYMKKKRSNQYVEEIREAFIPMADEDLVKFVELCKKVPIAHVLPEDFATKLKEWTNDAKYRGSKPTLALLEGTNFIKTFYEEHKISTAKKFSWGAFIQCYEPRIAPLAAGCLRAVPIAESFHYSRAFYMILDYDQAFEYIKKRLDACLSVLTAVMLLIPNMSIDWDREKIGSGIKSVYNKWIGKLTDHDKMDEIVVKMREKNLTRYKLSSTLENVLAAYFADYRMLMQCKSIRMNGFKESYAPQFREMITRVLKVGGVDVKAETVLDLSPKNKDQPWREQYFKTTKFIKAVTTMVRAYTKGGPDMKSGGKAKRDYSAFVV